MLSMGLLVLVMVGMSGAWTGISAGQTINGSNNAYLFVHFVFPPIWHTNYDMRLCSNFFPTSSDLYAGAIPPEYDYQGKFKTVPWSNISGQSIGLTLECRNGYQNETLSEQIKNGFLRNYTQLYIIEIISCEINNITENSFLNMSKLRQIDLTYNQLEFLHPKAFWSLKELNWVRLLNNKLTTISPEYFCNNPKLSFIQLYNNNIREIKMADSEICLFTHINSLVLTGNPIHIISSPVFKQFRVNGVISVSDSGIRSLSVDTFQGIPEVLGVDLSMNLLTETPPDLFQPMNQSLQLIDLNDNSIGMINITAMFGGLKELLEIRVQNNTIQEIYGRFSDFPNVRDLFLGFNKLTVVHTSLFQNCTALQHLDLTSNRIELIQADSFRNCESMKHIDLSGNRLKMLPPRVLGDSMNLVSFNISFNNLEVISTDMFTNKTLLTTLDISRNSLTSSELRVPESLTFLNLSINSINELSLVPVGGRKNCSLTNLNMSSNMLKKVNIGNFYKNLKILDLSNNSIEDIGFLGGMHKAVVIQLRSNRIHSVCQPFTLRDSVEVLNLGNNLIVSLCKDAFVHTKNLTVLELDNNRLTYVNNDILKEASNLKTLTLSNNPLHCDCHLMDLQQFLTMNSHIKVDSITCSGGMVLREYDFAYCKRSNLLTVVITCSVLFFIVIIAAGVVAVFRYEIQVIAFYKWNIRLTFCKKSRKRVSFKYDVFVCFAEDEINFVKRTFLPILEPKYRVCVYYRDFFVGDDIADAIIDVIENSAVTVILLSKAFLNSRWGQFEFKHAHYQCMTVENQKLILVVMEDAVLNMRLPDLTLRSILFSKVYLTKDDILFREKLIFAMQDVQSTSQQQCDDTNSETMESQPLL